MSFLSALRLDKYRDEDEPEPSWVRWHHLLIRRDESVAQDASPTIYSTEYERNPHYEVGHVVLWTHWGLGVDVQADLWPYDPAHRQRDDVWNLGLIVGPLHLWAVRRSSPNRTNVFET